MHPQIQSDRLGTLSKFCVPRWTLLLLVHNMTIMFAEEFSSQGAMDVTIPSFGPNGMINWTLNAEEVIHANESTYFVKKPNLKMVAKENSVSNATSDAGTFDLSNGTASGETLLKVSGDGFLAKGNPWFWRQQVENGTHQMSFESNAYVHFQSEIEPVLPRKKDDGFSPGKKVVKVENTVAMADMIEMVTREEGGYLFVLDGNVSVKGELLEIHCLRMDIIVENESNKSGMTFGRITEVNATGNVQMKQVGRLCQANRLTLDTVMGKGLLLGNAKVEDAEWGIVSGEKIELDKGTGRARVVGTEQKKPRLDLPNFGEINLPGLRKPQKKSPN